MPNPIAKKGAPLAIFGIALILVAMNFYKTVPPGHVGVATLFGNVQQEGYTQGLHIPVNPLYRWTLFDARQQTHMRPPMYPARKSCSLG